jgi:Tfp pilus assembly PilM family ATPase
MVSSKRIGFLLGEEKVTFVRFEKNALAQVISSPLDPKTDSSSPFSANFNEEIQTTAIFNQLLQDKLIQGGPFYISLPLKEVILRSFVIPFVKPEDIQNVIKFEVKKYLPIDIQELNFIFYTSPFTENKIKRLQVIFFAVRKESLARYDRIFKQANVEISYCEPCAVSLAKVLLFKKEINPADLITFLILEKNLGRIFFINQGIPQFSREFSIIPESSLEKADDSIETLNLKIVNEVENSFDFYARQFRGHRIEKMLVSAETFSQDLTNALEAELKIKVKKASPAVTAGPHGQSIDMDTLYAMGACVEPPIEPLAQFNFFDDKTTKSGLKGGISEVLKFYKECLFLFFICVVFLVGANIFFQAKLKVSQQQYDQLSLKQGASMNVSAGSVQDELKNNTDKLNAFKNIRTKSDVVLILLRVASHLPQGVLLSEFNVTYNQGDAKLAHVTINMKGDVFREDFSGQVAVVNQIFSDLKQDKELFRFIEKLSLVSLNREEFNGKQATGFTIQGS